MVLSSYVFDFTLGGVGGMVAKTITAPLEKIRIILQVQEASSLIRSGEVRRYKGIFDCGWRIATEQGIWRLWDGNLADCLRYFPTRAFGLATEGVLKRMFPRSSVYFAMAGTCLIGYPWDYARTRLASDVGLGPKQFGGFFDCVFKTILGPGRIGALFMGFCSHVVCVTTCRLLQDKIFSTINGLIPYNRDRGILGAIAAFCAKRTAVPIGLWISYPFDTVCRRLQLQANLSLSEFVYKGNTDCMLRIIMEEGYGGLFAGCGIRVLSGVIQYVVLVITELVKDHLDTRGEREGPRQHVPRQRHTPRLHGVKSQPIDPELVHRLRGLDRNELPSEFFGPITLETMTDPVLAADGHTYERAAIEKWIRSGHTTSPVTNEKLASTLITPNFTLRSQMMRAAENVPKRDECPRIVIVVFGAPCSGKSTQGNKIADELNIPLLTPGDMLREAVQADTRGGLKAKEIMSKGGMIPDSIIIDIIKERILNYDCFRGFVLDGFPRTIDQAKELEDMLATRNTHVALLLAFDVDEGLLEERVCGRWIHKASSRCYHVKFYPPHSMKLGSDGIPVNGSMKDDVTGEALMQRSDDKPDVLKKRLSSYHSQKVAILEHYVPHGVVRTVDGGQTVDKVWSDVKAILPKTD